MLDSWWVELFIVSFLRLIDMDCIFWFIVGSYFLLVIVLVSFINFIIIVNCKCEVDDFKERKIYVLGGDER